MGADEFLWIKGEGGKIEFSTDSTDGTDGTWHAENPYSDENSWNENTYINNMKLTGKNNNTYMGFYKMIRGYGLRLNGHLGKFNFINNGIVSGTGTEDGADVSGSGIYIYIPYETAITITNEGVISGAASNYGSGIYMNYLSEGVIKNEGAIIGTGAQEGRGIYIESIGDVSASITNEGVIYGQTDAIYNNGKVNNAVNYGILANLGNGWNTVGGLTVVYDGTPKKNELLNKGLIFKAEGTYKAKDADFNNFGKTFEKVDGYTIINAKAQGITPPSNGNEYRIDKTKSITIKDGSLTDEKINISSGKKYILNGITDTLLVSGNSDNNLFNNSVINAYTIAVAFDSNGGNLTLSGTTVNGGIDGTSNTIEGKGGADILGLYNTIINGNIDMGGKADTLTIGNRTIINGTLDGGADNDTLNFNSSSARASNSDEINIQHNVSRFEEMNINTNVTLFDRNIGSDGKLADVKVTGADKITIGKNGVLTLRINSADNNKHALSTGNIGTIKSENGGKLLLALNGAGNDSIINFGGLELDSSLVTEYEGTYLEDVTLGTTSIFHSVERVKGQNSEIKIAVKKNLPRKSIPSYEKLNKIYQGIGSVNDLIGNFNVEEGELPLFLEYLNSIYGGSPYSFSSELSRKSAGMFRDIVTENQFKANTGKWMIYGGLTHVDGGTKDTYYGKGYYTYDVGSSDIDADTKITGAYMLGEYGVSDTLTSGVVIGGNKLKSDLSNGSKVDGSALYLGAYAKKYLGNLKVTAGAGFQYGDYDADRLAINKVASSKAEPVMKYSDNYNDMTYDIYLNGRYSHQVGDNLFLEPYATLSYTYIDQDGADEGSKTLAIETDSKSFDYTTAKVGADLKKVIPHEKGKSTLSAGVSYTRILDGADEEYITGRFKGGSDFDILVAHKNEHSIGLNAKYTLELENGILFDVKGTYSVERDSHNQSGKNKTKGEWIVGTGLGYKF